MARDDENRQKGAESIIRPPGSHQAQPDGKPPRSVPVNDADDTRQELINLVDDLAAYAAALYLKGRGCRPPNDQAAYEASDPGSNDAADGKG